MPGISGMVNTFNAPNFVGELFQVSPTDTPFLSAIGGLTGGLDVNSVLFTWSTTDLRNADDARQRLEGADAPSPEGRSRNAAYNVVEVHQEALAVSYTKLAASGQYASTGAPAGTNAVALDGVANAAGNELAFQVNAHLRQVARDIEKTFITGTFAHPADNTAPRKTRGLLQAITTNVTVNATPAALTEKMVNDLSQLAYDNGGLSEGETATIIVNSVQKRNLTKLFVRDRGYAESTRNVGGIALETIVTDFGRMNIMLDRYMPQDTLVVCSLEECAPVFLPIPGKGFLFLEELAKTGASQKFQLYGEVGLKYGNERKHAKITNLTTTVQ